MRARQVEDSLQEECKKKKKKNKKNKKKGKKAIVSEHYVQEVIDFLMNTIFEKNKGICYIPEDDQEKWVNGLRDKFEGLDDGDT